MISYYLAQRVALLRMKTGLRKQGSRFGNKGKILDRLPVARCRVCETTPVLLTNYCKYMNLINCKYIIIYLFRYLQKICARQRQLQGTR